ncbi:hypothetical protein EVAR_24747_1 [Eumeta japonica]|uniref:Uncharacterized protein n=1 Tax=Eumeta variegata TaxID=151549 RepID=A0A4C1VFK6_EUMVA|nr:hypothetical protein EVAR_24747_1 [Eumeta japonica]
MYLNKKQTISMEKERTNKERRAAGAPPSALPSPAAFLIYNHSAAIPLAAEDRTGPARLSPKQVIRNKSLTAERKAPAEFNQACLLFRRFETNYRSDKNLAGADLLGEDIKDVGHVLQRVRLACRGRQWSRRSSATEHSRLTADVKRRVKRRERVTESVSELTALGG